MTERFDIPEFLKVTDEDRRKQELLRNVNLRKKSREEVQMDRYEMEADGAKTELRRLYAEGVSAPNLPLLVSQSRRLAIALMYLGEFDQALEVVMDADTQQQVLAMKEACNVPDYQECSCEHDRHNGKIVENRTVKTHVRRNGQIVGVVVCSKCGFTNAGGKLPKRIDDSANRDPRTAQHFVDRLHSTGR